MSAEVVHIKLHSLKIVPDNFKIQDMCGEAVDIKPYLLEHVPDQYRTQEMCDEVICIRPASFFLNSNCFKKLLQEGPWKLCNVPNHFKTQV